MTIPPESPKRKNDAPKNRLLRLLLPLLLVLITVFAVVLLWLGSSQPKNDLPTARLIYPKARGFISFNLQTGEQTELPLFQHSDLKLSPDGKWNARWMDINTCCASSLELRSTDRDVEDITLGDYYGTSASISWMPDSQWIAFSAEPQTGDHYSNPPNQGVSSLHEDIYLKNIYTYEEKRLTVNDFTDRYPAISPDGTKIAYTSDVNGDGLNRLYIMDIATQESRMLTVDQDGYKASWSPDGRWIAFISNCHTGASPRLSCKQGDLWIIRADGTGEQSVMTGIGAVETFWLP